MTRTVIDDDERRNRLADRHLLRPDRRVEHPSTVAESLVALHATDPATVFLSAAVRLRRPSVEKIEQAIYDSGDLLRHHAMRRTLWMMTPAVAAEAHASSTRKIADTERRKLLKVIGESVEVDDAAAWLAAAIDEICELVDERGSVSTRSIGDLLPHLRVRLTYPASGGTTAALPAHARVVLLAGFEGRVRRGRPAGSWIGSQYDWSTMPDALGLDDLEVAEAAAGLLDRWLRRFGPGTVTDLRWWTGWTKAQVMSALDAVAAEPVLLEDGSDAWVAQGDSGSGAPVGAWVAVLPALDPTSMGWKERSWYLADDVFTRVVDRYGNIGPTIWVDGHIVGGWVQRPDGEIAVELLRDVPPGGRRLIDDEIDRIREFVGDTRFRVRFPSPNQADLLA